MISILLLGLSVHPAGTFQNANTAQSATSDDRPQPILDYYDGLRMWDAGEKDLALGIWLKAADLGDLRAMRRLGQSF